jgi:hypothetical protein
MPTTINDELTRIEGAKADIATAIGGKGVTVPTNAKIDDFADLIDAIQTSGGSDSALKALIDRSITSIDFPSGITSIGAYAFAECSIPSITIPNTVTEIGSYAFYNCSSLTNIIIPNSVTNIKSNAFFKTSIQNITLPNSIIAIESAAFRGTPITSIVIPDSVTSFGSQIFYNCSKLTSVKLGTGVAVLSTQVFFNCSSLEKIIIPSVVTTINSHCFNGTNLTKIVLMRDSITALGNTNVFNFTAIANGNGNIYVPNAKVNDYKTASNWSSFASSIEGWQYDANNNICDMNGNIIVNSNGEFV